MAGKFVSLKEVLKLISPFSGNKDTYVKRRYRIQSNRSSRTIENPFAKQWLGTIYDTVGTYENFKIAFVANLPLGKMHQAQTRCSIFPDHKDK